LTSIDLWCNSAAEANTELVSVIKLNTTLKKLEMYSFNISSPAEVLEALYANTTLTNVDLSKNNLNLGFNQLKKLVLRESPRLYLSIRDTLDLKQLDELEQIHQKSETTEVTLKVATSKTLVPIKYNQQ